MGKREKRERRKAERRTPLAQQKLEKRRREIEEALARQCPKCGSKPVAAILYGLPLFTDEQKADIELGIVTLGGCVVGYDSPAWRCKSCGYEWGSLHSTN